METFRTAIKRGLTLACVYSAAVVIFIGLGYVFGSKYGLPEMSIAFASGFFIGLQSVVIYFMAKYRIALRDEEKLKTLYIEEHDERSRYIAQKTGGFGINIILGGLSLSMLVAVFLNKTVFITLLAALLFCVFVKLALELYYKKTV